MSLFISNKKVRDMKCNLCGSEDLRLLIDFGSHPIAKHYLDTPGKEVDVYPVRLYFCEQCGLTQLQGAAPADVVYDNYVTLSSWKNQPHCQHEVDLLERVTGVSKAAKVIEVGSNDGSFLKVLEENGFTDLLGVEPAGDAYRVAVEQGIHTINQYLNKESAYELAETYGKFDLLVTRQNLEHIQDLGDYAECISMLVRSGGWALVEVPNYGCNLKNNDYSLWEEHVNYFTVDTLRTFLRLAGLEVKYEEIFLFSGEGIFILAEKVGKVERPRYDYVNDLGSLNQAYADQFLGFREKIREYLVGQRALGAKVAVYGAGARVICLVNFLGLGEYVDAFVDDQPEKQEKYVPGCKKPIMNSSALREMDIDICLLGVNTENEQKAMGRHAKWVHEGGEFYSVLPPSDMLLPVWSL